MKKNQTIVATFYKFVTLSDVKKYRDVLYQLCVDKDVKGTILVAEEGINGTICGTADSIRFFVSELQKFPDLHDLKPKYSIAKNTPFKRFKVKIKKEIVSMREDGLDVQKFTGRFVSPDEWQSIIDDPDTVVIDTRNKYENSIGTFPGSIDPDTKSFRDFPNWVRSSLAKNKDKPIAMFCTGGIRCEKASSFLLKEGFTNVVQLEGGILKYLEQIPELESKWIGECFVFDDRVTVKQGLLEGDYDMCHACRMPLSQTDKNSIHFIDGVSCHNCYESHSDADRKRFAERQKQINLAEKNNKEHLGQKFKRS